MLRIDKSLDSIFPELVRIRREFHSQPELAWQEFETTHRIIRFLETQKIENIERPMQTGVVAQIGNDGAKPTVVLRADMDALPVQDEKKVEYRSTAHGICHACGHDVHMTIALGTAAVLKQAAQELPVNVRFVFQPAEEPIPSGAPKMLEKNILQDAHAALGMHVDPALALGKKGLTAGWVNAQAIRLEWKIRGRGGHSARPHLAADPLWAGTRLIQDSYQTAYRLWSRPDYPVVLSFTRFNGGNSYNIIPEIAGLTASLRVTNVEMGPKILDGLRQINRHIENECGVEIEFDTLTGSPPVMNDKNLVSQLIENWKKLNGNITDIENEYRSMGGDDFGWYSQKLPAAMVRFGTALKDISRNLHTGLFDVPEEVIRIAVDFFAGQLLNWNTETKIK